MSIFNGLYDTPEGAHSAVAIALRVLFEANRNAGLPERISGVAHYVGEFPSVEERTCVFTPIDYMTTLSALPPDAKVELSPIAVPDGEAGLYDGSGEGCSTARSDDRYRTAVAIYQFEAGSSSAQYDAANRLCGFGYTGAQWGTVDDRGRPVDNNPFGMTIVCVFNRSLSIAEYAQASRALRGPSRPRSPRGPPGVRSQKVRESQRKLEDVGAGREG